MFIRNNKAREERARQIRETELMSARFPSVSKIVFSVQYKKKRGPSMLRTLNFRPGSHAFFKLNCLGEECVAGGLDITGIVSSMVRNHNESASGNLHCANSEPAAVHADMSYAVSITYA
jgi:hypothetical protein